MARSPTSLPPTVLSAVADFKALLREEFGERLREVRLFGSVARGTAHEDSDTDVLVLLADPITQDDRRYAWGSGGEILLNHEVVLGVLVLSESELAKQRRSETALAAALDRDGILL